MFVDEIIVVFFFSLSTTCSFSWSKIAVRFSDIMPIWFCSPAVALTLHSNQCARLCNQEFIFYIYIYIGKAAPSRGIVCSSLESCHQLGTRGNKAEFDLSSSARSLCLIQIYLDVSVGSCHFLASMFVITLMDRSDLNVSRLWSPQVLSFTNNWQLRAVSELDRQLMTFNA